VFEEMDLDHDGVITGQQLHEALAKMGAAISERDVAEFLKVSKVRVHDTDPPHSCTLGSQAKFLGVTVRCSKKLLNTVKLI
jgi:hypothetical protein